MSAYLRERPRRPPCRDPLAVQILDGFIVVGVGLALGWFVSVATIAMGYGR